MPKSKTTPRTADKKKTKRKMTMAEQGEPLLV
jgi:hypothetical protein